MSTNYEYDSEKERNRNLGSGLPWDAYNTVQYIIIQMMVMAVSSYTSAILNEACGFCIAGNPP